MYLFTTIKKRLKNLKPEEFPVLFTYGDVNLYWYVSPKYYTSLSNDFEVLNNLKEFFSQNLEKKQLNKYYKIKRKSVDYGNGIQTLFSGSYDIGCAGGTMHFGIDLDNYNMVEKIDEYIAKYENKIYKTIDDYNSEVKNNILKNNVDINAQCAHK